MSTYTEKVGSQLNNILERTYDAEKGYLKAAENVADSNLKNYFKKKAQERYDFGHALKSEIKQYNQDVDKGDSFASKAHRSWMDVKEWFSADSEEAMLEEAIKGEKAAIEQYEEVLDETNLPPSTETLLTQQKNKIVGGLEHIKKLEDLA
ncbi:PA2169 family four-helix-bundle protein [Cytophaga sp. FL35]|uniref:ferritin-like domain-containing protein n=1 Tax=Cytophaga sp. FL35 TaxID=1904456 RepID=UPI001653B69F|nr:PA2169 family four-helix-bundle protein [Cytophaga sp. FL35]MBC6998131.1 PA2169 family four-helix-bundle protein [Cytophaga sp. FL35]